MIPDVADVQVWLNDDGAPFCSAFGAGNAVAKAVSPRVVGVGNGGDDVLGQ